jgi:MFS transporter, YNFM family, putative membrane transport protein
LIFLVYLAGIVSSTLMGRLADVHGRGKVLPVAVLIMAAGVTATLAQPPAVIVAGLAVATFGFFGGHSIASSWVSRRAARGRAQATAAYLFSYYAGSSVSGTLGGLAWHDLAWPGVVILIDALLACALALAVWLAFLPPVAKPRVAE